MPDCLIIDDDASIAASVCEYFNLSDVSCEYATDYETGMGIVMKQRPSLILLDINLGGRSGFALCKKLRETSDVPIIFLSARSADSDILMGLGLGGDDYITKPFSMQILLAKAKAALRRSAGGRGSGMVMHFGTAAVLVDRESGRVLRDGKPVRLKPLEYKLFCYLLDHPGRLITKEELLNNVWQDAFTGDGTLSVHIRRLREKLEETPDTPSRIKTVWGSGYIFEANEAEINFNS